MLKHKTSSFVKRLKRMENSFVGMCKTQNTYDKYALIQYLAWNVLDSRKTGYQRINRLLIFIENHVKWSALMQEKTGKQVRERS